MPVETIEGETTKGTRFTVTVKDRGGRYAGPRFDIEVPEKKVSFTGSYSPEEDAITGYKKRRLILKLAGEARERVRQLHSEWRRRVEAAEAEEQAKIDAQPSHLALILSGHYLMEWEVGYVREATTDEREKYADWVKDRLVYLYGRGQAPVEKHDSPTARRLADSTETRRGEKTLPSESRVIPISEEERDSILAECRQAEEERLAQVKRRKAEKEAERNALFDRARESGERVEIGRYTDDCDDRHEECSLDIVTQYAMPDATTQTHRMHTW